jgi:hypothetical protein
MSRAIKIAAIVAPIALAHVAVAQLHVPADFPTIQAAVDAAMPGETILVAPGDYVEQVTIIDKDLSIVGDPGATMQAFPGMVINLPEIISETHALIASLRSNVSVSGLAFDGQALSAEGYFVVGVYFAASDGVVSDCSFTRFRSDPYGLAFSRGVSAFNLESWHPAHRHVTVVDSLFTDGSDSINMGGDTENVNNVRITAHIEGNTIIGQGPVDTLPQRGVWFQFGVDGEISHNTIAGHIFLGEGDFSLGILTGATDLPDLVSPRLVIQGNTLTDNLVAIAAIFSDRVQIVNNSITGGTFGFGAVAVSGDQSHLVNNHIDMSDSILRGNSGVALLGLEFGGPAGFGMSVDALVAANTVAGADLPIWVQTGVEGAKLRANKILP